MGTSSIDIQLLKDTIDKLDETHHIHIGSLLRQNSSIKLNANKSGVLVNFSTVPTEVLENIQKYVDYVADQEKVISKIESTAEDLKNSLFLS
jgi:hypothetical protein